MTTYFVQPPKLPKPLAVLSVWESLRDIIFVW